MDNNVKLNQIIHGDCLDILKTFPNNFFDCVITDPPAGIAFMGKSWDKDKGGRSQWIAWMCEVMTECNRVLKPGGHALVWALPRTSHWTATAIEDAGLEIREKISHAFGSGFPKSLDISKQIDKQFGAKRTVIDFSKNWGKSKNKETSGDYNGTWDITASATDMAKLHAGYGTALKPAYEDWILARKPLERGLTVAENVLKWGTGGLNLGATRVEGARNQYRPASASGIGNGKNTYGTRNGQAAHYTSERFPPNLLFSHSLFCTDTECDKSCPIFELDRQSGISTSKATLMQPDKPKDGRGTLQLHPRQHAQVRGHADEGGASRYFPKFRYDEDEINFWFHYTAKASQSERNKGLDDLPMQKKVFNGQSGKPSKVIKTGSVEDKFSTGFKEMMQLRDDLTPEQETYVMDELRKAGVI